MALGKRKRYRLGGDFAFRDGDGVDHFLTAGTELGPNAMANFNRHTIAVHVSTGLFREIDPDRQGVAGRLRSFIVRTT